MRFIASLLFASAVTASAVEIESFSPQGGVSQVRQVKARFNGPVVRFGDPRGPMPFSVQCSQGEGSGRWIDERTWVYDFKQDLPAGSHCKFTPTALKALDGSEVGSRSYAFSTGGPEPIQTWPSYGWISEDQTFLVSFALPPTAESLQKHARCVVEGIAERIPALRLAPAERDRIIAGLFERNRSQIPSYSEAFRCQRPLPAGAQVQLVFDSGLAGTIGTPLRQPMSFSFEVQPPFKAELRCERHKDKTPCVPVSDLHLDFTTPISAELAAKIALVSADGRQRWKAEPVASEDVLDQELGGRQRFSSRVRFRAPFPESAQLKLQLPAELRDQSGRALANAREFPLTVRFDQYPPLAKFAADFGIVERAVGTLPVTLRNVGQPEAKTAVKPAPATLADKVISAMTNQPSEEQKPALGLPYRRLTLTRDVDIVRWYRKLQRGHSGQDGRDTRSFSFLKKEAGVHLGRLPAPADDRAAEVIGIPLTGPGLHIIEVESQRLGRKLLERDPTMYVASAALHTNLAVHFRAGNDESLVWVTTLDQGWLVNDAAVAIYNCNGKQLASGRTNKQGVWLYPGKLSQARYDCPQFVLARSGDDIGMVSSDWHDGIEPWRFNIPTEGAEPRREVVRAVLDRGLYRRGETMSFKLVGRLNSSQGFAALPAAAQPNRVRLIHYGSSDSFFVPITWQQGSAIGSWKVPAEAKLGNYSVIAEVSSGKLDDDAKVSRSYDAGYFSVSEFRVPLMRAMLQLPQKPVAPDRLNASVQLQYLAGGPAAGERVRLRGLLSDAALPPLPEFEEFTFANGDVAPEVRAGVMSQPQGDEEWRPNDNDRPLATREAVLDKTGAASLELSGWTAVGRASRLTAELEYSDPNGEIQTAASSTTLWPAAVQAGLRFGNPRAGEPTLPLTLGVADLEGRPLAGRPLKAEAWLGETVSHRRRLVGGFYAYRHETHYKPLGVICEGRSNARGRIDCNIKRPGQGELLVRVAAQDDAGRISYANSSSYSEGEGDNWWEAGDGDRIDLLADKRQYQPGETAAIQIRMPFRQGTALVAVEREKVLDWYTMTLNGTDPTIKLPIKPHYGPNVFVSVLVVRGRVAEPAPTALIDLGKPAHKLGMLELKVGDQGYALDVKVAADRPVYQVRDKARVRISVKTRDGRPLPPGAEVALAAVDEGLLALRPNDSWRLLPAMLGERPYSFEATATAQGQVIGRRHFGRKAVAAGGGGGRTSLRELFDTLLLWQPRVALDARGEATVEVPLNDSLTSFRIAAVATAGNDRFGSGETNIRASKDVMLFSGLANTVREEDRFEAGFTVRNTLEQPVKLTVSARAEGLAPLPPQTLTLAGGAARELSWPVEVPVGLRQLAWTVSVNGDGGRQYDQLALRQAVIEAVPVRTLQSTLVQLTPNHGLPLERPRDALPGRGGVRVALAPSLALALDGVERYFERYPYSCLEQQSSSAIGRNDRRQWTALMSRLPLYLDGSGLAKFFPPLSEGSPGLTAHLLAISADSGFELPEAARLRMQSGLEGYINGRVMARDSTHLAERKLEAIAALARYGAARPAMLEGLALEPNRWPVGTLLDWIELLERMKDVPRRAERLAEARQILLARLDLSGSSLVFSTERDDYWWWLLDSPDSNAARLLLGSIGRGTDRTELGRLARGLVLRQKRGHWDTTVANAWGAVALRRFAAEVESGPPAGVTVARLEGEKRFEWQKSPKGGELRFDWPAQPTTLKLEHQGAGRPWALISANSAVPLTAPLRAGYSISKRWEPVETRGRGYGRGDVWRVRLEIDAQADMGWVVVDDPIPAGATLLGRGLSGESALLARNEASSGAWPSFEERGETAYRAYFAWMRKGRTTVEYTVRLNNRGEFRLPSTRVEAMYAPERFGELPNPPLRVE
ncbi:alpha-2-macroglobulin family protein [Chitinimonas lacunae]|uniref:Alpha-2-macroglobulin n=1 Tax=Chitinimonas lacunae TaxID=1963018 RepID=A0ABV8MPZ4_9NEIS